LGTEREKKKERVYGDSREGTGYSRSLPSAVKGAQKKGAIINAKNRKKTRKEGSDMRCGSESQAEKEGALCCLT